MSIDHYVNGDPAKRESFTTSGRANQFGYFVADKTWKPEAHGEYIVRVTATYTDPIDGTVWMGTRAGASIVATPNTSLVAHGERNREQPRRQERANGALARQFGGLGVGFRRATRFADGAAGARNRLPQFSTGDVVCVVQEASSSSFGT